MERSELRARLACLSVYRHLLTEQVPAAFCAMLDSGDAPSAAGYFYALRAAGYAGLGEWLWDALRFQDSPYGLALERGGADKDLEDAARADVETLMAAAALRPEDLPGGGPLPRWQTGCPFDFDSLSAFYREQGCGLFARHRAFRWSGGELWGIAEPDSPQPWELWGYADQRGQVRANALALVQGKQVNHVLLYGDSGTGKSATVKSLLSQEGLEKLRIIEMDKDHLEDIPRLVRTLEARAQKFILFIDDLAFDADDKAYSQLKTILEGSLEKQPDNVVVYATSNRRNLVKQNFSDRNGDEIDRNETIAEKTSLAERFGVRIAYFSLTPAEFWQMIEELSPVYGLHVDKEPLLRKAKQWELRHPGRTPRIAKQFIAHELEGQG